MAEFHPQDASSPSSQVELSVSCRNLIDMDVFSKSDPLCVLYGKDFGSPEWKEFGRTEIIWDNLDPDFVKKFNLEFHFEERQELKFELYDVDCDSPDLSKHDFLGSMKCSLGEIVSSVRLERPLKGPKPDSGSIIVSAEELRACKSEVSMVLSARNLDKKDFFGKSDPFLQFYKVSEDGTCTVTHRTEYIPKTLNPQWKPMTVPVSALCNGDYQRPIKIECYDWNRTGNHEIIGECFTTLKELSDGHVREFEIINKGIQAKRRDKYKNSGILIVESCKVDPVFTFIDYITGGLQLQVTVAVDFTASNRDPKKSESLHYLNASSANQYETAIRAVGEIIQDYDSDKMFPALGFGAKLPPDGKVSHEFFLNGHPTDPYCTGLEGIMAAYRHTLNTVQLYGPTNFAPVINHVSRFAAESIAGENDYFILLIITDGIITDMPQATQAIVNAAKLPMSIVIIGVGTADFREMETLDGDDVRISYDGIAAERDIVQFVPFLEVMNKRPADTLTSIKARLAREVLAEIPDQFMSYMKARGIRPKPPSTENKEILKSWQFLRHTG